MCRQNGKPSPTFSGDSPFARNRADGAIDCFILGSDDSYRQLQASHEGRGLHFQQRARADPAKVPVRSVRRRIDAESIEVHCGQFVGSESRHEPRPVHITGAMEPACDLKASPMRHRARLRHDILIQGAPAGAAIVPYSIQWFKRLRPAQSCQDLITLFELLRLRQLKPLVALQVPLWEAKQAHGLRSNGAVIGKIVLLPHP